jgi:phosphate transport system substrate-binding protein
VSPALSAALATADKRPGLIVAMNDKEAADHLEKVAGAIGPTSLAQILAEQRRLRPLALNGVAPTPLAIADGSYPLYKTMLLVTGPKTPPEAHAFVAYVRSAAGREILQQLGHWVR